VRRRSGRWGAWREEGGRRKPLSGNEGLLGRRRNSTLSFAEETLMSGRRKEGDKVDLRSLAIETRA
jgi:hypothetical protein